MSSLPCSSCFQDILPNTTLYYNYQCADMSNGIQSIICNECYAAVQDVIEYNCRIHQCKHSTSALQSLKTSPNWTIHNCDKGKLLNIRTHIIGLNPTLLNILFKEAQTCWNIHQERKNNYYNKLKSKRHDNQYVRNRNNNNNNYYNNSNSYTNRHQRISPNNSQQHGYTAYNPIHYQAPQQTQKRDMLFLNNAQQKVATTRDPLPNVPKKRNRSFVMGNTMNRNTQFHDFHTGHNDINHNNKNDEPALWNQLSRSSSNANSNNNNNNNNNNDRYGTIQSMFQS